MTIETAPMKASELGRYVCVHECQHSPHITISYDGVWVKQGPGGPFSSSHRDCYGAWADCQGATRVDELPNGLYQVTSSGIIRTAGTRTDALALAEYLEARTARTAADPELFRRTAPAWNCVDYPGAMHYLTGAGPCAWCGMTRAEITEDDKRLTTKQENQS